MLRLSVEPDFDGICRYLGYRQPASLPARLRSEIRRQVDEGLSALEPRGSCVVHAVTARSSGSISTEHATLVGRVGEFLADADPIVALAVTVGTRISELSRAACQSGDALAGWVFDAVGSWAAEAAADALVSRVRSRVEPGIELSPRYSPGYCGMALDQQPKVIRLAQAEDIGIVLLNSQWMVPEKSLSGILGLGGPSVTRLPCVRCPEVGCHMRRGC